MVAGISTACFYPMKTEQALALLAKEGVRQTEVFLNSQSELSRDYLLDLRKTADEAGMRILSVHPFTSAMEPMLFFSEYTRRFEDGRDYYRSYYEAAGILGADIVVFHGNFSQFQIEPDEYHRRFGVLMEDAEKSGVRLCHENVSRCSGRSPDFFRDMSRALPKARYVLDVKQARRAGEDVFDFLDAMAGQIAHVHISDHKKENDCLSIGKGVFNIPAFLKALGKSGFSGGVLVELYRDNYDDFVDLFDGYQLLCAQISTVA